jgi:hypothetical protein
MMPLVRISNLKNPTLAQLKDAVAKFERDIYDKAVPPATSDISTLQQQISNIQNQLAAISIVTFPGFGSDHLHVMRGDYVDPALKFFMKTRSQAVTAGDSTITFDATVPFSSAPVVWCWTIDTNPFGLNSHIATSITTTGFTVSIDIDGTLFYTAFGSR